MRTAQWSGFRIPKSGIRTVPDRPKRLRNYLHSIPSTAAARIAEAFLRSTRLLFFQLKEKKKFLLFFLININRKVKNIEIKILNIIFILKLNIYWKFKKFILEI